MADEAREYVRAAQQAELRGDKAHAAELLMKAAVVYRNAGRAGRALQVLQHARRLDGSRRDVAEEVRRLEWLPDRALERAVGADDVERALAALEPEPQGSSAPQLVERGPALADPALDAWCSFCCRPKGEVGALVAGPAGAFVCAGCAAESGRMLGHRDARELPAMPDVPTAGRAPAPASSTAAPSWAELEEHTAAQVLFEAALRLSGRVVLVVGSEGAGKSAWLRRLERDEVGVPAATPFDVGSAPDSGCLLVDAADGRPPAELDALGRWAVGADGRQLVIAVRGQPPRASLAVSSGELDVPLYSSQALLEATGGRLPAELLSLVHGVVAFPALSPASLEALARAVLTSRAAELEVSDELVAALALEAHRSGRGGHEVEVLVRRLPPGSWSLKAGPGAGTTPPPGKPRRGRKRAKKAEGS